MDIEVTFPGGVKVDASYKGFTIKTDQPKEAGGEGSAPNPFDLFLASLATCAGFFALSFCRDRKLSTEGLKFIQRMEHDEATHRVSKVSIEIILPKDFPDKYKGAIVKAAELCKVMKHVQKPPAFEIVATEG